jgi:F0F1-type ATP synthase assembly protein I
MAGLGTAEALAIAWSLGWRIAAGIVLGYYADKYLGTTPWLTLVFSLTALIASVRSLIVSVASGTTGDGSKPPPS